MPDDFGERLPDLLGSDFDGVVPGTEALRHFLLVGSLVELGIRKLKGECFQRGVGVAGDDRGGHGGVDD